MWWGCYDDACSFNSDTLYNVTFDVPVVRLVSSHFKTFPSRVCVTRRPLNIGIVGSTRVTSQKEGKPREEVRKIDSVLENALFL